MTEEFKPGDRVVLEGTVKSLSAEGHYVFVTIDPDSDDPEWGWFPLSGLRHAFIETGVDDGE